ncbi:solute carrier family 2, facilitated glucose transporter member 7 isoform X2 [Drosophila busckii]|uniref:solute carrier family 2, facilitated glucose transporter member 7 isoform X2 n=1 Tax=Drosophila busckii TaxID=30019 RepID=UPI00083EDF3C|nr:solute carrier family 2, facilitated glucose transporter member 7 isoform X2 [Drosophila busckii]
MRIVMHIQDAGWTPLLLVICVTVTIGTTVPVGYFFGVLNAPAAVIKRWCHEILDSEYDTESDADDLNLLWSFIVSVYLIGGICGSCFGAWFSNKFGRKGCLLISCMLLLISALLFAFCRVTKSLELLMLGRFAGGIASALIFTAQPMYLLELAPNSLSGSVGVFTCIGVTGGILLAQLLTLPELLGNEQLWPHALAAYALLVLLCLLPLWRFPESPRWLYLIKGDTAGSEAALQRLRGKQACVQQELQQLQYTQSNMNKAHTLSQALRETQLRLPLLLVCILQASQQLSGINAIFFYSLSILTEAGFSASFATWLNLGLGSFNLCASLLSPLLLHRFARRPLIFISCALCAFSLLCMSFALYFMLSTQSLALRYVCIVFILLFILGFQLGLGPIAFFIGSELLEDAGRPVAMSAGSLFSWLGNFLIGMCFPLLQSVWSSFAFLPCMCVCIFCLLFSWRYLPETLGREPKDVAPLMSKGLRSKVN